MGCGLCRRSTWHLLPNELRARRTRRVVVGGVRGRHSVGRSPALGRQKRHPPDLGLDGGQPRPPGRQARGRSRDAGRPRSLGKTDGGDARTSSPKPKSSPSPARDPTHGTKPLFGGVPSFRGALLNAGLEPEECAAIEQALQHIVDFRRCRPEHKLIVERDETAGLKRFEYHPSATEFVEVTRGEDGVVSRRTDPGEGRANADRTSGFGGNVDRRRLGRHRASRRSGHVFRRGVRRPDQFRRCKRARATFSASSSTRSRWTASSLRYGRVQALEYDGQRTGKMQAFYYRGRQDPGAVLRRQRARDARRLASHATSLRPTLLPIQPKTFPSDSEAHGPASRGGLRRADRNAGVGRRLTVA